METRKFMLSAVALAVGLSWMAGSAAAGFTLKVNHSAAPGDPRDQGAHKVASIINGKNSCGMKVQIYPSDQLGGSNSIMELVQIGAVEAHLAPAANLVSFEPLLGILDLPYFWPDDPEKLMKVYQSDVAQDLMKVTEAKGFVVLGIWHTGYKQWTGPKPMVTPEDFKGIIARVMPSKILYEQNRLLGIQNVSMDFGNTYSALQTGTIQAQDNPVPLIFNMKFYEVQKYMTMTSHGILDQAFMVSKKWWDKLPESCQGELRAAVAEGSKVTYEANEKLTRTDLELMKKSGLNVVEMSNEQKDVLRKRLEPAVENYYIGLNGEKGKEFVDRFNAEFAKMGS